MQQARETGKRDGQERQASETGKRDLGGDDSLDADAALGRHAVVWFPLRLCLRGRTREAQTRGHGNTRVAVPAAALLSNLALLFSATSRFTAILPASAARCSARIRCLRPHPHPHPHPHGTHART